MAGPCGSCAESQHSRLAGCGSFSALKDIAELLALRRAPGTSCADIKLRATRKIEEVDRKIRELERIRDDIRAVPATDQGQTGGPGCR